MTSQPPFIAADQVAQLIGMTNGRAFLRERARLEDDTLFPLPMPTTTNRNLRWRTDEVLAWRDRHGKPLALNIDPGLISSGKVHLLELARTA